MINYDTRNNVKFQHSDLKVWTRDDNNALYFLGTDEESEGQDWIDVRIRQILDDITDCVPSRPSMGKGKNQEITNGNHSH